MEIERPGSGGGRATGAWNPNGNRTHMKTSKANCVALAASLTFIVMAGLVPSANADNTTVMLADGTVLTNAVDFAGKNVVVPAGTTSFYATNLCLTALTWNVGGTLAALVSNNAAPNLQLPADQAISVTGGILGHDGATNGWANGLTGAAGGAGSSLVLAAPSITVGDNARLVAGNGGAGQSLH